jgi:UDP-GlcNAc:undecaprenyl-phosphate/decaprenyl-phosphate GlcNAc-1-phosphate transferase
MIAMPSFVLAMFPAAIAFLITLSLVPIVRILCIRYGLLDAPGPLKIHIQPVPRLGGVAVVLGICGAAFLSSPQRAISAWPFFVALALIWAAGFADDLRSISPVFRLGVQFIAGALLWRHGWRLPFLGSGPLDLLATAGFVAAFANSINLLDGMDGLAAGVVATISAAYLALPGPLISPLALLVASVLAAACVGFLPFNFASRAKIYLGDSGSTILGGTMAFLALDLYRYQFANRPILLFPLLIAAIPLLDGAFAIIRRSRARASPLDGDRRHLYDLIHKRGWPARRIVLAFYGATALLAAVALWGVWRVSLQFWIAVLIGVRAIVLAAIRLGVLQSGERSSPARDATAQRMEN